MEILGLNKAATQHLGVLDLDLGVVEDEIVVVYVFDNFYRLILTLFLRARGASSSLAGVAVDLILGLVTVGGSLLVTGESVLAIDPLLVTHNEAILGLEGLWLLSLAGLNN